MVSNTRRRALGLLLAAAASLRISNLPRALAAAAKKQDCFESKPFGAWKAQATDAQAGARINEVSFVDGVTCDLRIEVQVAASMMENGSKPSLPCRIWCTSASGLAAVFSSAISTTSRSAMCFCRYRPASSAPSKVWMERNPARRRFR